MPRKPHLATAAVFSSGVFCATTVLLLSPLLHRLTSAALIRIAHWAHTPTDPEEALACQCGS